MKCSLCFSEKQIVRSPKVGQVALAAAAADHFLPFRTHAHDYLYPPGLDFLVSIFFLLVILNVPCSIIPGRCGSAVLVRALGHSFKKNRLTEGRDAEHWGRSGSGR